MTQAEFGQGMRAAIYTENGEDSSRKGAGAQRGQIYSWHAPQASFSAALRLCVRILTRLRLSRADYFVVRCPRLITTAARRAFRSVGRGEALRRAGGEREAP